MSDSDNVTEDELRQQGVVPVYALADIEREECRGGKAPWINARVDRGSARLNDDNAETSKGAHNTLAPYRQGCPPLIFGGSVLGKGIHSDDDFFASSEPYKVVRLALQYGITALDTSPYYHPSEISLGRILKALRPEYPRESYYIQTKVGRYGPEKADFDYRPQRVRQSVKKSLARLDTTYLDAVLMHDVEFVATTVGDAQEAGFVARDVVSVDNVAADKARHACGLAREQESEAQQAASDAKIHGEGDQVVLEAVRTLFAIKDEGIIRNVGIGGLPLPVLLRLSRLIASHPPFRPLDVIVSYSHHTLNNDLLMLYRSLFAHEPSARKQHRIKASSSSPKQALEPWQAPRILNASPFSMGLLLDKTAPAWHPASDALKQAARDASTLVRNQGRGTVPTLVRAAARFGIRGSEVCAAQDVDAGVSLPTIVGVNTTEQVHEAIEAYRVMLAGAQHQEREARLGHSGIVLPTVALSVQSSNAAFLDEYRAQQYNEELIMGLFAQRGLQDWIWASGK